MQMPGFGVTIRIMKKFSSSWQYTEAHLAGVCRRQLLLDMFDEADTAAKQPGLVLMSA